MQEKHIPDELLYPPNFEEGKTEEISRKSIGFWKDAFFRLRKNKGAVIAFIMIVVIVFLGVAGPHMNDYGFDDQDVTRGYLPPKVPILEHIGFLGLDGVDQNGIDQYERKGVDEYFWFGTDDLGRDMWTRIWQGTQVSLFIAVVAASVDLLIGVIYGSVSAFYGGRTDNIMQRIVEVLVGLPNLILIMLAILVLRPGIISIIIALTVTGWVGMSRIVRGQILKLKNEDFALAARTLGASDKHIIFRQLFPNTLGPIIITTMFTIPNAIFFEAFLSFIGLGIPAPRASLGSLASEGYSFITIYPHIVLFPAIVISILMISFNLFADGLRDAFDPKMRK